MSLSDFNNQIKISVDNGKPNQTILEKLEEKGTAPSTHCREGFCGACRVKVLKGQAEHFQDPLGWHDENTEVLACISKMVSEEAEFGF